MLQGAVWPNILAVTTVKQTDPSISCRRLRSEVADTPCLIGTRVSPPGDTSRCLTRVSELRERTIDAHPGQKSADIEDSARVV